jgi:DNA-binding IclR family transcriptional regulator
VRATAHGELSGQASKVPLGLTGNAHARASGKLLLSSLTEAELTDYLARHPMAPRTASTLTDPTLLTKQIEWIRRSAYAVEQEEFSVGLSCLAVPLGHDMNQTVLGISVAADRFRINIRRYLRHLTNIASRPCP